MKIDKVYLETHRDTIVVDQATLDQAKRFFEGKGVKVAGGITITINETNQFETYCYSNPEHRKKLQEVVEFTARNFDEFILDDFFFTSCKCDLCIKAKGNRSWTDFRLALMDEAGRSLVDEARAGRQPEGEDHHQVPELVRPLPEPGLQPRDRSRSYFDKIYTGTETRDGVYSNQHLQPYHGYSIFRYFENIKPGGNAGGWVDTGGLRNLDRYAEQLWLTLFAKAPEITLFDIRQLYQPIRQEDGSACPNPSTPGSPATSSEQVDSFAGRLGDADRREDLQAVPLVGRGPSRKLPRHDRHPDGHRSGLPGRSADRPAHGGAARTTRPSSTGSGGSSRTARTSSSRRVC